MALLSNDSRLIALCFCAACYLILILVVSKESKKTREAKESRRVKELSSWHVLRALVSRERKSNKPLN